MCNHVYTANYKQAPKGIGERCPCASIFQKGRSTATGTPVSAMPLDKSGRCIFHSLDAGWKRENDFTGWFQQLLGWLVADTATKYYDLAEFVFVGGSVAGTVEPGAFEIVDTVLQMPAYFTAAHFLDSFSLEKVDLRGGADFSHATFDGDLRVTDAKVNGLQLNGASLRQAAWFTRVELVSYALFCNATFTGKARGIVVKFEDTRFDAITDFSGAGFILGAESSIEFLRTRFEDFTDFKRTRFHCHAVFSAVSFADVTEFIDTSFEITLSSARYRGAAVQFDQIEVGKKGVLVFESTDPQRKLFSHDVRMSFKEAPMGLVRFQNVNFVNILAGYRDALIELARLGKVEIGPGCIKYRFQTPVSKIDVSDGNGPLILKLCETFANYFTVKNGLNLGLEVVERTATSVSFFFFTDEDISGTVFEDRLDVTAQQMWSLLGVRSSEELLALEANESAAQTSTSPGAGSSGPVSQRLPGKGDVALAAVEAVTTIIALLFNAGFRAAVGKWTEADTRAFRRALPFKTEDLGMARELHVVLSDRYTSRRLFDISGRQHAGLIMAFRDEPPETPIDFAIVTAIGVERRAVCRVFGLGEEHKSPKGSRVYWRGSLPLGGGRTYGLVVAEAADAANVDAALLTNDMLHHWKPSAVLLVGIAATTDPGKVILGDVVAGSDVYYYERGKVATAGTIPEPRMISADATLWSAVKAVADWDGATSSTRPEAPRERSKLHYGVIASGEKVIADAVSRDQIKAGHRKIIAIEMEGFGFSRAVWQSFEHVRHLVIRGISDDGSKAKNDDWHEYAASAAAAFAKHFLLGCPLRPKPTVLSDPR